MLHQQELTELLRSFPGIGQRQAARIAMHIMRQPKHATNKLVAAIQNTSSLARRCPRTNAYFIASHPNQTTLPVLDGVTRNPNQMMLIEKEDDLYTVENAGIYSGEYFIIRPIKKVESAFSHPDIALVLEKLEKEPIHEVIVAFSLTSAGEALASMIQEVLKEKNIKISQLARGLSRGNEIEYVDPQTLKQAIQRRMIM